jgi:3-oxoadipate enol-lactonase
MGSIEGWATEAIEAFSFIKPLADRLPQDQFEVTTEDHDRFGDAPQHFLNSVARAMGLRQAIHVRSAPQLARSSFGLAIQRGLRGLLQPGGAFEEWAQRGSGSWDAQVERAAAKARDEAPQATPVETRDGVTIEAFTAGQRGRPAVMLIPPCGMPVELSRYWLRALAEKHFVITWQTRGLFSQCEPHAGMASDVTTQAGDLLAVMDALAVDNCHLMGFCGGAVIALRAAHQHPERFHSMSLWHGDYDFGDGSTKTDHQRDVQTLMEIGAQGLDKATAYQKLMQRPSALAAIPERFAPLVIYPYATPVLFHNYCRLNHAIMCFDIAGMLGAIALPALVVTSRTDTTAHPEGSHRVRHELPNARLVEEPSGDHLSVFDASTRLTALAVEFVASHHRTQACRQ